MTPRLVAAVMRERVDEVREALRNGVSVDEADDAGRTALTHAAIDGLADVVRVLLAATANPRVKDRLGMTPLHYAVQGSHADVVQALLASGADPNAKDSHGNSPTHKAVLTFNGSPKSLAVLKLVVTGGGDVGARNSSGVSAQAVAAMRGVNLKDVLRAP